MELERNLEQEVLNEVEEIGKMQLGSDEYTKTVNGMNAMADRVIKIKELTLKEREIEVEQEKNETEKKKTKGEMFNNIAKHAVNVILFGVCVVVNIWANKDSKDFEMGYTHTTTAGKESNKTLLSLMNKFKPMQPFWMHCL